VHISFSASGKNGILQLLSRYTFRETRPTFPLFSRLYETATGILFGTTVRRQIVGPIDKWKNAASDIVGEAGEWRFGSD